MAVLRFKFRLPPRLVLLAEPGRHSPCLHGCVLTVDAHGAVEIEGPSRDRVLDQTVRFLRVVAKEQIKGLAPPETISAVLVTGAEAGRRGGRDGWMITVGADVAISPTALEPHIVPLLAAG